jgi:hypothetical protein
LNGHEHSYERFARQTPWAKASRQGIRHFVVGSGGTDLLGFAAARPNSQRRLASVHGVLELVLHPASYEWRFVSEDGAVLDKGGPSDSPGPAESFAVSSTGPSWRPHGVPGHFPGEARSCDRGA